MQLHEKTCVFTCMLEPASCPMSAHSGMRCGSAGLSELVRGHCHGWKLFLVVVMPELGSIDRERSQRGVPLV